MTDKQHKQILSQRDYYLSHPDMFAKDFLRVNLICWQKKMLKELYQQKDCSVIYYPKMIGLQFARYAYIFGKCILENETHIVVESRNSSESKRISEFIKRISKQAKDELSIVNITTEPYIKFKNGSTITIVEPKKVKYFK